MRVVDDIETGTYHDNLHDPTIKSGVQDPTSMQSGDSFISSVSLDFGSAAQAAHPGSAGNEFESGLGSTATIEGNLDPEMEPQLEAVGHSAWARIADAEQRKEVRDMQAWGGGLVWNSGHDSHKSKESHASLGSMGSNQSWSSNKSVTALTAHLQEIHPIPSTSAWQQKKSLVPKTRSQSPQPVGLTSINIGNFGGMTASDFASQLPQEVELLDAEPDSQSAPKLPSLASRMRSAKDHNTAARSITAPSSYNAGQKNRAQLDLQSRDSTGHDLESANKYSPTAAMSAEARANYKVTAEHRQRLLEGNAGRAVGVHRARPNAFGGRPNAFALSLASETLGAGLSLSSESGRNALEQPSTISVPSSSAVITSVSAAAVAQSPAVPDIPISEVTIPTPKQQPNQRFARPRFNAFGHGPHNTGGS